MKIPEDMIQKIYNQIRSTDICNILNEHIYGEILSDNVSEFLNSLRIYYTNRGIIFDLVNFEELKKAMAYMNDQVQDFNNRNKYDKLVTFPRDNRDHTIIYLIWEITYGDKYLDWSDTCLLSFLEGISSIDTKEEYLLGDEWEINKAFLIEIAKKCTVLSKNAFYIIKQITDIIDGAQSNNGSDDGGGNPPKSPTPRPNLDVDLGDDRLLKGSKLTDFLLEE